VRVITSAALAALALAGVGSPPAALAQAAGPWVFCYVDPPTYRSGPFVFTQSRYIGGGPVPLAEVTAALTRTAPQVAGRQVSCWRYASAELAEAKRQEGIARERSRSYTILESDWTPQNAPAMPVLAAPEPAPAAEPAVAAEAPTAAAVEASVTPASAPAPAASASMPAAAPAASLDKLADDVAQAAGAPATPPPAAPDPQAGAVATLNSRIIAAEAMRVNQAAQAQAEYQKALADHARKVAEMEAQAAKAQADYEAAVKACRAGDFSKCGGPPVPIKK
jgi:hypothetical protein